VDDYRADEAFYLAHIDSLASGRLPAEARRLYRRAYSHVAITDESLRTAIRRHVPPPEVRPAMEPLFRNATVQAAFERDGYVVIDLIDRPQVDALRAFYQGLEHAATPAGGFQVSLDNESPSFVRAVSERLIEAVRASVDRHFDRHRVFTASFVTKAKDPTGIVPPHQDWTFVDERRYASATIWCPLVDVDRHNGGLGVIAGSHRLYNHIRPSPSPQYVPPFTDQLASIFPYVRIIDLRAGQALVFDNRTLHASPPNASNETRVAFGIGITHRDAAIRHYYLLPGQHKPVMEGYDVEPGFFHHYNNARLAALHRDGGKPQGLTSVGVFPQTARKLRKFSGPTRNSQITRKDHLWPSISSAAAMDLLVAAVLRR
jgi:ectoine hydroxylase-related dioxygenase (phytanoyl-CoA dioxygenase family)